MPFSVGHCGPYVGVGEEVVLDVDEDAVDCIGASIVDASVSAVDGDNNKLA